VRGINNGKEVCSYVLKTADKARKIKLVSDNADLKPGEIAHIEVNITDKNDLLCPNEELIEFSLEGGAEFLGACSGDLTQSLGFTKTKVVTFEGKALAMIKACASGGNIVLNAYCKKLEKASLRFRVK
jgi:hypothetical protein